MSRLWGRGWKLALPILGASARSRYGGGEHLRCLGHADQGRGPVGLRRRVRGVRQVEDLAGVVSAMSEYAGAKPVNPNDPRKGWTGGSIGGHPVKLVGIGCSNDRADTAIKETRVAHGAARCGRHDRPAVG